MKVITGKYRGRKITHTNQQATKSTLQRAKESIFNMLPHFFVKQSKGLDVFAGCGQLGIEALSRGIGYCVFNEHHPKSNFILRKNLESINERHWQVSHLDYHDLITKHQQEKFDLIIIDPPFDIANEAINFLLNFIEQHNMLAPKGFIIGQAPLASQLKDNFHHFWLKKDKAFSQNIRIWQYVKR